MITLEILDYNGRLLNEFNWQGSKPIPNKGDTLLIHIGDDEYRVTVLRREFDCTRPEVIGIVTDYTTGL